LPHYSHNMNIFEHEEALESAGFKREQVRALLKFVSSGDAEAFSKRDGEVMEQKNQMRFENLEARIENLEKRMDDKLDAVLSKMTATIWTVGGVMLAAAVGLTKLGIL